MSELFPLEIRGADSVTYDIIRAGVAPSTLRRYSKTVRSWLTYCGDRDLDPIDATTDELLRWLDAELRRVNSSCHLSVCLSAVRIVQRAAGGDREPIPYRARERPRLGFFVRSRLRDAPNPRRARPLLLQELHALLTRVDLEACWPRTGVDLQRARELGLKYRAMLSIQWWGALRADDLTRLESVERVAEGLIVKLRDSKTGPATLGLCRVHPDVCPVLAWDNLTHAHPEGLGPITAGQVSRIVIRYARLAGLPGRYTGHSLRSGFATECARQNVPDRLVQRHARWRNAKTHELYIRDGRLFADSPTSRLTFGALEANPLLARAGLVLERPSPEPRAPEDIAPPTSETVAEPVRAQPEQLSLPPAK